MVSTGFKSNTHVSSFDGVSWKAYTFKTLLQKYPIRINEIELAGDGVIWVGTSDGFFVFDKKSENFIPLKPKVSTGKRIATIC
jgi:ligand-binding sensor domain-containing protein